MLLNYSETLIADDPLNPENVNDLNTILAEIRAVVNALDNDNIDDLAGIEYAKLNLANAIVGSDLTEDSVGVRELDAVPVCRVHLTADETTVDDTVETLSWGVESAPSFDPDGMHAGGSPTRITAPIAGLYEVCLGVAWESSSSGYRECRIHINGTGTVLGWDVRAGAAPIGTIQTAYGLARLAANDYIEGKVQQGSGGDLDVLALAGSATYMSMRWVGP